MAKPYWERAARIKQAAYDRASNEVVRAVNRAYNRATEQLNDDIERVIGTYKRKTGLSAQEAFDYLNNGVPPNIYNDLLLRAGQITNPAERVRLETMLRTNAYSARITRMQEIQDATRVAMTEVADVQLNAVTKHLQSTASTAYSRTMYDAQKYAGVGFRAQGIPSRELETILRSNWSGSNYSKRIWSNRDAMSRMLDGAMLEQFSIGKLSDRTLQDLRGKVDLTAWMAQTKSKFKDGTQYAKYAANRIIRTETSFVSGQAVAKSYDECGIDYYEFIATLDGHTSPMCQRHDGLINPDTGTAYETSKKIVGKNWPPLHPFCRSTTCPVVEGLARENMERSARDANGKLCKVPADMKYEMWSEWQKDGAPSDVRGWMKRR